MPIAHSTKWIIVLCTYLFLPKHNSLKKICMKRSINIVLPPKIVLDRYLDSIPIENVAHFNANDNSPPYYTSIVLCMLETTCCTHAPIPKTPSSSSSNLKAPHRVRHNHLQNSAGCCCLYLLY